MKNKTTIVRNGLITNGHVGLYLEGVLSVGKLEVEIDLETKGKEKRIIVQGKLAGEDYYATFLNGDTRGHLALFYSRYRDQSTTLFACDEKHEEVGSITFISGTMPPKHFRLDLKKLNVANTFDYQILCESILDEKKDEFLRISKYTCDPLNPEELNKVFGHDPAYLAFKEWDMASTIASNWHPLCWLALVPIYGIAVLLFATCRGGKSGGGHSNLIPNPDLTLRIQCMNSCSRYDFGTKEFNACVERCYSRKMAHLRQYLKGQEEE